MHIRVRKWVKLLILITLIIISFFLYSRYIGIKGLNVKEYAVIDSKIPNSFYGFKIVQISDIHYKVTTTKDDLKVMVKSINLLKPDIVLLSGDLFDKNIKYTDKDYKDIQSILNSIDYNIGKYAIKGENDLNIKSWEEIINNSNFTNLNDKYELIYDNNNEPLLLVGIGSNYNNNHINKSINEIYKNVTQKYNYSILMLHEPDFIDDINYSKFNLILAGHSHNGQIVLPYIKNILKNKYSTKYYKPSYNLGNTKLYISSGIGTSNYKFRFLNKPSINLYRMRNK